MDRRVFLESIAFGGASLLPILKGAATKDPALPWKPVSLKGPVMRVRLKAPGPIAPLFHSRVYDAATGRDISVRFPVWAALRLDRSWRTGKPVRVALYSLGPDGRPVVGDDHRLAKEPATVQVVAWENRTSRKQEG